MPVSPIQNSSDIVSFTIYSEGRSIPETIEVTSIYISQKAGTADEAIISIRDGLLENLTKFLYPKTIFEITDSKTFEIGSNIEIKLGYGSKNNRVFRGVVSKQNIIINNDTFSQFNGSLLQVTCKQINRDIKQIPEQKLNFSKDSVLELEYSHDVIEANVYIDEINSGDIDAEYNEDNYAPIKGHVTFQGSELAKVGDKIDLKSFGHRFGFYGKAIISGVNHKIKEGNWITKVYLGNSD